jgi:hypothetical protein
VRNRLLFSKLGKVRFTSHPLQLDIIGGWNSVTPLDESVDSGSSRIPVSNRACRTQRRIEREGVRWEPRKYRVSPKTSGRAMYAHERAS